GLGNSPSAARFGSSVSSIRTISHLDPDSRTVTWPNRADFAPDFLYFLEPEASPESEPEALTAAAD
ncbi:MAG: hypothetical protein AAB150_01755, partial [Pseudomonadota bacterium]